MPDADLGSSGNDGVMREFVTRQAIAHLRADLAEALEALRMAESAMTWAEVQWGRYQPLEEAALRARSILSKHQTEAK